MKRFATFSFVLAFASAGSTALAEETTDQLGMQAAKPQPELMTEAQLDTVAAGQVQVGEGLVVVQVNDVPIEIDVRALNNSVNNNRVFVPIAANVNAVVGLLGNAAGFARQLGRQTQIN